MQYSKKFLLLFLGLYFGVHASLLWSYPMSGKLMYNGFLCFDLSSEKIVTDNYLKSEISKKGYRYLLDKKLGSRIFFSEKDLNKDYEDPAQEVAVMYDYRTQKRRQIPDYSWFFMDKDWVVLDKPTMNREPAWKSWGKPLDPDAVLERWVLDLKREEIRALFSLSVKKMHPVFYYTSYSYLGAYFYCVDPDGQLIERDLEAQRVRARYDLSAFLKAHKGARYFRLSPPSPDLKYIAMQAESELYLFDLEKQEMRHVAGKAFGFIGNGVEGPMYWDRESKYLLFGANFDTLGWVYDHDVYYYDVEKRSVHQINPGHRRNGSFWYSWE